MASFGLEITVRDGTFGAYVARPDCSGVAPVVVVVQEIFGVNDDLRETCNELARDGFIAVAPDLFWRQDPGLDLNAFNEEEWKRGFELYNSFDVDRGVADIAAVVEAGRTLEGASGKVGIMGFCLGGLMTFLTAARTSVDAAASYYGGGTERYVAEATNIKMPTIVHLGDADEYISEAARDTIIDATAENKSISVFVYAGCSHAFARHAGVHYDAKAAHLANSRTHDLLSTLR